MNRLNKIILSFVLPFFCLFACVSDAFTLNQPIASTGTVKSSSTGLIGSIKVSDIFDDLYNKYLYPDDTSIDLAFNQRIQQVYNSSDYNSYVMYVYLNSNGDSNFAIYFFNSSEVNVGIAISEETNRRFVFEISQDSTISSIRYNETTDQLTNYIYNVSNGIYYLNIGFVGDIQYLNASSDFPIYNLIYNSSQNNYYWDGSYYGQEPEEPNEPTMPTNSEIAQAVQAFYDSDYYKNNKDFSDFMLLYNTTNGNCSFVGHTLGNILGQVIIPPNYRYQGRLYNEQWWKFYIDENQGALPYSSTYHLYSSNISEPNIISDEGIGKISELVNLDFSTKSTIVYSTTDYPVRTYVLDETTGDYTYTDGTIEGDQYTYDENLDPTISGYNPLDNFVTVDPAQTIVGNADFDDLSNSFENHKDLFSFTENMQWLIVANNKLSNYFLGFIIMCALFITLGRVLKG